MQKNLPNFDMGFGYLFHISFISSGPEPEEKKQKREEPQCFACLDESELNDLVDEAQAKSTKYATKYAANVFQGNFCI